MFMADQRKPHRAASVDHKSRRIYGFVFGVPPQTVGVGEDVV